MAATPNWNVTGSYVIDLTYSGVHYTEYLVLQQSGSNITGTSLALAGDASPWTIDSGLVDGDSLNFVAHFNASPTLHARFSGTIATDGSIINGSWADEALGTRSGTWESVSGNAVFNRFAEITSPDENEYVSGETMFSAYLVDNDPDSVQWAVRKGTCAAATNTIIGNVDGMNTPFNWSVDPSDSYKYNFSATADTSSWTGGMYCFVFNPTENAGDIPIRLTREFYVADGFVHGGGQLIEEKESKPKDNYKISFGGQVWDMGNAGKMGDWEVNFHNVGKNEFDSSKFHTTKVLSITFFDGDHATCNDAMNFIAEGEWNGTPGYELTFRAGDFGSPNTLDTVRIELRNSSKQLVYDTWKNWPDTGQGDFNNESFCVGTARTGLDNGNITIWQD